MSQTPYTTIETGDNPSSGGVPIPPRNPAPRATPDPLQLLKTAADAAKAERAEMERREEANSQQLHKLFLEDAAAQMQSIIDWIGIPLKVNTSDGAKVVIPAERGNITLHAEVVTFNAEDHDTFFNENGGKARFQLVIDVDGYDDEFAWEMIAAAQSDTPEMIRAQIYEAAERLWKRRDLNAELADMEARQNPAEQIAALKSDIVALTNLAQRAEAMRDAYQAFMLSPKWEHKTLVQALRSNHPEKMLAVDAELNTYVNEGWEVVANDSSVAADANDIHIYRIITLRRRCPLEPIQPDKSETAAVNILADAFDDADPKSDDTAEIDPVQPPPVPMGFPRTPNPVTPERIHLPRPAPSHPVPVMNAADFPNATAIMRDGLPAFLESQNRAALAAAESAWNRVAVTSRPFTLIPGRPDTAYLPSLPSGM
jgi:hypothetical protein